MLSFMLCRMSCPSKFSGSLALSPVSQSRDILKCEQSTATPSFSKMDAGMAPCTERDQVVLGIGAGVTAKLVVVNFQVRHCAARLTPPAITTKDLLPKILVQPRIQPQRVGFRSSRAHGALSLRPPRNACCCAVGRNLKNLVIENNSVSGSPLSRLAPARKSAQIISRQ